jgi:plasmid stabilization system protein ParE
VAGPSRPAKARFHPEAQAEYLEVIAYLGLHAPSAVEAFASDVQEAVDFIEKYPEGAPVERGSVRCKLLRRFPYELYYSPEADFVRVLAVAHQRRRPGYWVDRE